MEYKDQLKEYINFIELISSDLKDFLKKMNSGDSLDKNDITKISYILEFGIGVSEDFVESTKTVNYDVDMEIREKVKERLNC